MICCLRDTDTEAGFSNRILSLPDLAALVALVAGAEALRRGAAGIVLLARRSPAGVSDRDSDRNFHTGTGGFPQGRGSGLGPWRFGHPQRPHSGGCRNRGTGTVNVRHPVIAPAARGRGDLAAENVIGSCIFNTPGIYFFTALIRPPPVPDDSIVRDAARLPGVTALPLLLIRSGRLPNRIAPTRLSGGFITSVILLVFGT